MKNFSDFNIKAERSAFTGDKIRQKDIINRPILVEKFVIEPSKFEGKDERLKLQLTVNESKRIHFSGSAFLKEMIQKVPLDGFPFKTTIVYVDEHLEFT